MNVLLMLADYANVTVDGRVNVLGIFNQIRAIQFPAAHAAMVLVAKVTLDFGERAVTRPVQIRLLDESGKPLIDIDGELEFKTNDSGMPPEMNIILPMVNVVFPSPGIYNFVLLVNEVKEASVPVQVIQVEPPKAA